jgi:translation initiation factor IF-2
MTEQIQTNMKVYELAKELGLDSISLLDKLKEINVDVKNHMSSLEATQAEQIRAFFRKPKEDAAKKAKTVARRSTATKDAAAPVATEKAKPAKKAVASAAAPAPAAVEDSDAASSKRKIIKRRVSAEGVETTTVESAPKSETPVAAEAAPAQ